MIKLGVFYCLEDGFKNDVESFKSFFSSKCEISKYLNHLGEFDKQWDDHVHVLLFEPPHLDPYKKGRSFFILKFHLQYTPTYHRRHHHIIYIIIHRRRTRYTYQYSTTYRRIITH